MKIKFVAAAALIMALSIGNTYAQEVPNAPTRHHRIKQGVKSGELTKAEAADLRNDQKDVRQDIKDAKKDGKITRKESKEIRHDKKHLNREIFRKKHNNRERH
jgi:hypothetical protein